MWAVDVKAAAKLGGEHWYQGKCKCHEALLPRLRYNFLIVHSPDCCKDLIHSRILKNFILTVVASLLLLWRDGFLEFSMLPFH